MLVIKFDKGDRKTKVHGWNLGICYKDGVLTFGLWWSLLHLWFDGKKDGD